MTNRRNNSKSAKQQVTVIDADFEEEQVIIKQGGAETVYIVRQMDGVALSAFQQKMTSRGKINPKTMELEEIVDISGLPLDVLEGCLYTANYELVGRDFIEHQLPPKALSKLAEIAMRINGISASAADEIKKDLEEPNLLGGESLGN